MQSGQRQRSRNAPQWGRSFNVPIPASVQRSRVASVHLPHAQDVAIYLQGQTTEATATWITYQLSVGSGGISVFNGQVTVPAVGVVRHFVADTVDVDANMRAVVSPAGNHVRVAGCVGLGRPSLVYETGALVATLAAAQPVTGLMSPHQINNTGWVHVDANDRQVFLVPPWATRLNVQVANPSGAAATQLVKEHSAAGTLLQTRTAADYENYQPLDSDTWLIVLEATGGDSWDGLVTFEKFT